MKKKNIILSIFVWFLLTVMAFAQQKDRLVLLDKDHGSPITGAHIHQSNGIVKTISNNEGLVNLNRFSEPTTITISHIGYTDTTFDYQPGCGIITLRLSKRETLLTPHKVMASPVELIPDKPWYVSSYLICDKGVLLLAFPRKRMGLQSLFLVDDSGQVIFSRPWKQNGELFRDAAGELWLKGSDLTRSITFDRQGISIGQKVMDTREFNTGLAKIEEIIDDRYYFGFHHHDNQWLDYYCYQLQNNQTQMIWSITDPLGMKLRETRDIFETNEFERRFGEMCFFSPVFAPLAAHGSELIIFNYTAGQIEFFDSTHTMLRSVKIDYHQSKNFREILIKDRFTNNFYAVMEQNGVFSISKINLASGTLSTPTTLPSFPYIEQLSVHKGKLYFLYRDKIIGEYKKIFTMAI